MAQSDQEQSRESSQETVGLGITIPRWSNGLPEVMDFALSGRFAFWDIQLPSVISANEKKTPKESHNIVQTKNPIYSSEMLNRTIEGAIILY